MAISRQKWDESVPLHVASTVYDVPRFLRGWSPLFPLERKEIGPVRGRRLLHLQCHFGMDTLSWARLGAEVTGVDYSAAAVIAARKLARRAHLRATFIHSNVYDLPATLDGRFDIVYTGKGVLWWLPDLGLWAAAIARCLRPGGRFFLFEDHPIGEVFSNGESTQELVPTIPYFRTQALREEFDGTYATSVRMRHRVSYSWMHPMGQVISALTTHGIAIDRVQEYPFSYWRRYPFMTEDRQGYWHLREKEGLIPLSWSLRGRAV